MKEDKHHWVCSKLSTNKQEKKCLQNEHFDKILKVGGNKKKVFHLVLPVLSCSTCPEQSAEDFMVAPHAGVCKTQGKLGGCTVISLGVILNYTTYYLNLDACSQKIHYLKGF